MILARIVGTVVATRKDPRLLSSKLMVARPIDPHGKSEGNYLVGARCVAFGARVDGTFRGKADDERFGRRKENPFAQARR